MRGPSTRLVACALGILATIAIAHELVAQPPEDRPSGRPVAPRGEGRSPEELDDAELAGLPRGSRPEVLTWMRAYELALIEGRTPRPARGGELAGRLDLKGLAERSARLGIADFTRFRAEFLAGGAGVGKSGRSFRDPSGDYFELLRRLQGVENARKKVVTHEALATTYRELIEGASSGLTQLHLDQMDSLLRQARREFSEAVLDYRDRLEAFRVELGLSPRAPVVIDRGSLAPFRDVFEKVDRWSEDPQRSLEEMPALIGQLPAPGGLVIDGRSFLDVVDEDADRLEDLLSLATRVAVKNRTARDKDFGPEESADRLELRVRRRIRHLLRTRRAYEGEMREFAIAIRLKDTAFDRLIAPPQADEPKMSGHADTLNLIEPYLRILRTQNRLVDLWTTYRAERLALYRDLGAMPFTDWKSFYDQFTAELGQPTPSKITPRVRPASPIPAPPPAQAPPAPGR